MPLKPITTVALSAPNKSVTSSASANTLGNFTTLGTTAEEWDALYLQVRTNLTQDRNFLIQLYTNDSGSDVELGDPLPIRLQSNLRVFNFFAHARIPSGTAIKAKCMDATGSGALLVALYGVPSGSNVRQGPAIGVNCWKVLGSASSTASAIYTTCDAGAVANTYTSTTIGTTGADANSITAIVRTAFSVNSDMQVRILDDGTEILGSSTVGIYVRPANGSNLVDLYGPFPLTTIASGSSLTAQVACSSTTAGSREAGIALVLQNLPTLSGGGSAINIGSLMDSIAYAADSTSKSVEVIATTLSDGTAKTDLVYNTSGLTASYKRGPTGAVTSITLATQTSTGAYSSGGFVHLSNGRYRLDVPNAALASGADYVTFDLGGVSGVRISQVRVDLTGGDPRAATVDANVTKINNTTVVGAGTSGDKWRA